MGWKGIAFGAWIGSLFGGPLGAIFGAVLGHQVEKRVGGASAARRTAGGGRAPNPYAYVSAERRAMVFCASAAAMMAKLAKADGHVTADEIAAVERAFARLGFDANARAYAVGVFRRAKDDSHTIYEYAAEFSLAVESVEVRELFYGLLWDLACADGNVGYNELMILRRIPPALGIRPEWFELFRRERFGPHDGRGRSHRPPEPPRDTLADAYATLGVSPSASDADVKRAYRELAKKNHPDLLRAQGLPEELVGRATEKMGRINNAWSAIREARGI